MILFQLLSYIYTQNATGNQLSDDDNIGSALLQISEIILHPVCLQLHILLKGGLRKIMYL